MDKKHPHKSPLFFLNTLVIILGSLFLIWFYFLDGKVLNKPVHFVNGVDISNLQMVQETYHVGDMAQMEFAFCKTRPFVAGVEWTLIDGQKVHYGEHRFEVPVGCYPNGGGTLKNDIERIPLYITDTCDAYFVGVANVQLAGGRAVQYEYRTEKFCIKGSDLLEQITNE